MSGRCADAAISIGKTLYPPSTSNRNCQSLAQRKVSVESSGRRWRSRAGSWGRPSGTRWMNGASLVELVDSRCRYSQNLRKCRFKMRRTLSCLLTALSEANATCIRRSVEFAAAQWAGRVCCQLAPSTKIVRCGQSVGNHSQWKAELTVVQAVKQTAPWEIWIHDVFPL